MIPRLEQQERWAEPLGPRPSICVKWLVLCLDPDDDYEAVDFPVFIPEMLQRQYEETLRLDMGDPVGPTQAHFPHRDDGRIDVITGVPVRRDEELASDFVAMLDLADVERAVTIVRQGHFSEGNQAIALLSEWLEANGQETHFDHYREVYLQAAGPPETWVSEHQFVLNNAA